MKKKENNAKKYLKEKGITLIALVVTIVVLLILAGVSINALFGDSGIIEKAKEAQSKMDQATENDKKGINELSNWLDDKINETTGKEDNPPTTTPKISTLIGTVVDKNTKAEDAYGNKITIPKGFKILANGTSKESASYTYSGDNIPAVQDGIVIENGTDGNQFVWVPVGTIKNKNEDSKGTTSTITLGRYEFNSTTGTLKSNIPVQNAENYTQEIAINTYAKELTIARDGSKSDGSENATARNLTEFITTTQTNGGYYIARYEASGTTSKITSKYNQTVLIGITQSASAKLARDMYGEVKENDKLVYASDLVNSYAWDTAIIFIQTYGTGADASSYASKNKSTSFAKTGINSDKYCNIFDMSGNAQEWTTEYLGISMNGKFYPYVGRGGYCDTKGGKSYTSSRGIRMFSDGSIGENGLRSLLYVM